MPFVLSTPTLALRFRQNNGPTPSGDYQPSRSLSMAGSDSINTFRHAIQSFEGVLRSQHRVYDGRGEVARTQDVWGPEGISRSR
jgi:hypothetical protein